MKSLFFSLVTMYLSLNSISALEHHDTLQSHAEILELLQKWPKDFNQKNIPAVCELFSPSLVASYPGAPDRDFEGMCQKLSESLSDPNKRYRYQLPEIEQIITVEDLAIVRLIWTLEVFDKNFELIERVKEKGLDVFCKQKDQGWKIIISYAYTLASSFPQQQ